MQEILNAAFIGCGAIAQKKHLPLAKENPNLHIKMLYDVNSESSEACRKLFGREDTVAVADPEAIFASDDIDIVFIGTPNCTHAEYAIKALNRKKHVICEKPMACTAADAGAMLKAAKRNRRVLHISYQNRYTDQAQYVKRICEEGMLQDIYYMKAYAVRRRAVPTWGAAGQRAIQGGGALIDIGSHSIDLALWLSDNFEPAYAVGMTYNKIMRRGSEANLWGNWNPEKMETEDCAVGFVVMKNGMTLTVESAYALNTAFEMEASVDLFGTGAGVSLREEDGITLIHELDGKMCRTENRLQETKRSLTPRGVLDTPSKREQRAVIDKILAGNIELETARQACVTAAIVEGIYISAETGKPFYF